MTDLNVRLSWFRPRWARLAAIAVAVLGGSGAWGVGLSALFFGIIGAFADQLQFANGVSSDFALVVQAVAVIFVLLGIQLRARMRARAVERDASRLAPPVSVPADVSS